MIKTLINYQVNIDSKNINNVEHNAYYKGQKAGVYLINLQKNIYNIQKTMKFVEQISKENGRIVFYIGKNSDENMMRWFLAKRNVFILTEEKEIYKEVLRLRPKLLVIFTNEAENLANIKKLVMTLRGRMPIITILNNRMTLKNKDLTYKSMGDLNLPKAKLFYCLLFKRALAHCK